jgi:hypothetical protein
MPAAPRKSASGRSISCASARHSRVRIWGIAHIYFLDRAQWLSVAISWL